MVAGNRGGNGESGGDDGAKHRRANDGERDLSDCQRDGAGHDADKQRAQDASAAVKRGNAGGKADELCGEPRYVAPAWREFPWSSIAGFFGRIFCMRAPLRIAFSC